MHDIDGLVNLFGIESPGLTSSLAIAEEVRKRLDA
jgi:L-2-hydroxyglutarate oxidase LhgO